MLDLSDINASLVDTPIGRFRLVSLAEGLSFVLLMFVAMPLKYLAGIPEAVRVAGSLHGGLFIAFVAALWVAMRSAGWSWQRGAWFLFLSVIPLGALVIEAQARQAAVDPAAG